VSDRVELQERALYQSEAAAADRDEVVAIVALLDSWLHRGGEQIAR
jgi:hypothetical protein